MIEIRIIPLFSQQPDYVQERLAALVKKLGIVVSVVGTAFQTVRMIFDTEEDLNLFLLSINLKKTKIWKSGEPDVAHYLIQSRGDLV